LRGPAKRVGLATLAETIVAAVVAAVATVVGVVSSWTTA
jgi:hypothetical protein